MKDQICLKDAKTGNVSFVFEDEQALQDFLHIKPQWMKEENHQKVWDKFHSGILIKDKLPAQRINFVPEPMPEQRKNHFGAYIED